MSKPNKHEMRAALGLGSIFSFRMLGLFMILPIFSIEASHYYKGTTPELIGFAIGIYGLTQALLQIPFATLSDKIGRKPIIVTGLLLFALGSFIAGHAETIHGVILGRALQGAGAIGSTILALLADMTREETRTKAMAFIGMMIAFSFSVSILLGPLLNSHLGLDGIFDFTGVLAIIGIVMLFAVTPKKVQYRFHRDTSPVGAQLKNMLKKPELLRLNFGVMILHAILTSSFIALPIIIRQDAHITTDNQWLVYLPTLLLSFLFAVPFVVIAESKRKMKQVFVGAIVIVCAIQVILWQTHSNVYLISLYILIFFSAFTLAEATLPSMVSKIAPAGNKGSAMGIYSSCQFLGIFIGGSVGGLILKYYQPNKIFLFCAILALIWIRIAHKMKQPPYLSSVIIGLPNLSEQNIDELTQKFRAIDGVEEAALFVEDKAAYLKVDKKVVDENQLNKVA